VKEWIVEYILDSTLTKDNPHGSFGLYGFVHFMRRISIGLSLFLNFGGVNFFTLFLFVFELLSFEDMNGVIANKV